MHTYMRHLDKVRPFKSILLAETPGVARDYIRNEGTRKINLVLYKNHYNLQRFKPPEKEPRYSMNRRRGGLQNRSGCQATPQRKGSILYTCCQVMDPERTPKKTPPLHSNKQTYGQPARFAFIYIEDVSFPLVSRCNDVPCPLELGANLKGWISQEVGRLGQHRHVNPLGQGCPNSSQ
jgi:hypothetical protein